MEFFLILAVFVILILLNALLTFLLKTSHHLSICSSKERSLSKQSEKSEVSLVNFFNFDWAD